MDTSTGEELPCEEFEATLKPVVPNIMLVLDKSGSMVANPAGYWDHDNNANTPKITRWNSLYDVVAAILTAFNDKINFGANLFPSTAAQQVYGPQACVVSNMPEVKVKPLNKDAILAAIPPANDTSLKGGTPAAAGVSTALTHLKTLDPEVPRAIMLITDGAANCRSDAMNNAQLFETYDQNLHTIVGDAWTIDNIPTYVVGIDIANAVSPMVADGNPDNINPTTKLNELATSGGKPKNDPNEKFYNANNQIELQAALNTVISDALSCVIPLANPPAKPELTEVEISGMMLEHIDDCANENGWAFTNPNGPYDAIVLCGTACTSLKMVGKADVNFFCVPN
jgi:hypothetical protein